MMHENCSGEHCIDCIRIGLEKAIQLTERHYSCPISAIHFSKDDEEKLDCYLKLIEELKSALEESGRND